MYLGYPGLPQGTPEPTTYSRHRLAITNAESLGIHLLVPVLGALAFQNVGGLIEVSFVKWLQEEQKPCNFRT